MDHGGDGADEAAAGARKPGSIIALSRKILMEPDGAEASVGECVHWVGLRVVRCARVEANLLFTAS
jgi:hypothetical protein